MAAVGWLREAHRSSFERRVRLLIRLLARACLKKHDPEEGMA